MDQTLYMWKHQKKVQQVYKVLKNPSDSTPCHNQDCTVWKVNLKYGKWLCQQGSCTLNFTWEQILLMVWSCGHFVLFPVLQNSALRRGWSLRPHTHMKYAVFRSTVEKSCSTRLARKWHHFLYTGTYNNHQKISFLIKWWYMPTNNNNLKKKAFVHQHVSQEK